MLKPIDNQLRTETLVCKSGPIMAAVGDRFVSGGDEFEIVEFRTSYKSTVVICKWISGPNRLFSFRDKDGMNEFCGDSVAAFLMTKLDGEPRCARGTILNLGVNLDE